MIKYKAFKNSVKKTEEDDNTQYSGTKIFTSENLLSFINCDIFSLYMEYQALN